MEGHHSHCAMPLLGHEVRWEQKAKQQKPLVCLIAKEQRTEASVGRPKYIVSACTRKGDEGGNKYMK